MRRLLLTSSAFAIGATSFYLFRSTAIPVPQTPPYIPAAKPLSYADNPNKQFLSKSPKSICIIGAGVAGLAAAQRFLIEGYDVTVFEGRDSYGGVWHSNYDNVHLQGPYPHYVFPDFGFPEDTEFFPPLSQVNGFLKNYIQHFGIDKHIRYSSEVTQLEQNSDETWKVHIKGGSSQVFDFVILAQGITRVPYIPAYKGLESFKGDKLHSTNFVKAENLVKGKDVVVTGAGKSAQDICSAAKAYGAKSVTNVRRQNHVTVPLGLSIYGTSAFGFLTKRTTISTLPKVHEGDYSWYDTFPQLMNYFWTATRDRFNKGLPEPTRLEGNLEPDILGPFHALGAEFEENVKQGFVKVVVAGDNVEFQEKAVVANGKEYPADVVVFGNGFQDGFLDIPGSSNEFLYKNIIKPGVRNIAFIGKQFAVCTNVYNSISSLWLAEVIRGRVILPSVQRMIEMEQKRKQNLEAVGVQRHGENKTLEIRQFDFFLADMGIEYYRKANRWKEFTESTDCLDYKTVITHRVQVVILEMTFYGLDMYLSYYRPVKLYYINIISLKPAIIKKQPSKTTSLLNRKGHAITINRYTCDFINS